MPNKQGFTLVEVIISIALIAILSVGFVYLTSGSMRMLQVNKVQHDTYQSFVSAVEEGQIPAGATEQVQNTVTLQLSNHNTCLLYTSKKHHNVGGLPDAMHFELVEPLKMLLKDEVHALWHSVGAA